MPSFDGPYYLTYGIMGIKDGVKWRMGWNGWVLVGEGIGEGDRRWVYVCMHACRIIMIEGIYLEKCRWMSSKAVVYYINHLNFYPFITLYY